MTTPSLSYITQDDFSVLVLDLAAQMRDDREWQPDFIIGIGRGGLVPGTYLSHALGMSMLSVDYSSQDPDFSSELLVKLAKRTVTGERFVFVDDINDSGRTIRFLKQALADAGAIDSSVRFATLVSNVSSSETVDYSARSIDRRTMKHWFVFPWEAVAPRSTVVSDAIEIPDRLA